MILGEGISGFINYLSFEKRNSPHTIISYQNDLSQFQHYLSAHYKTEELDHVNHLIVRSWLVHLMNESISARSVARKLSSLKSFYKFLLKENLVKQSPLSKVQAPKIEKRLPVFVEKKQMENLFEEGGIRENIFDNTFSGRRDMLMLNLFYSTGIRLSELIGIKINDVDLYKGQIKVLGKRNKERIIPLTNELAGQIKSYIELKKAEGYDKEELLLNDKGLKLSPRWVYAKVKQYLSQVTSVQKRSPHVLRHTYATHLLNEGADLNAIKELLGHASLAATQVYTHNSIERLKEVYKKKHPRSK